MIVCDYNYKKVSLLGRPLVDPLGNKSFLCSLCLSSVGGGTGGDHVICRQRILKALGSDPEGAVESEANEPNEGLKAENELSEEEKAFSKLLEEIHESQCAGGYEKFVGERRGAMKLAFELMKQKPELEFSDALREAWGMVKEARKLPCKVETEES